MSEIDRYTEQEAEKASNGSDKVFAVLREQVLNTARSTNSYKDQTGNPEKFTRLCHCRGRTGCLSVRLFRP